MYTLPGASLFCFVIRAEVPIGGEGVVVVLRPILRWAYCAMSRLDLLEERWYI